ncbi:MAG: efflux transporter outer membrane subunit [Dokdonella sp.]|nr:efflux transporter outer membrane subunit [Dokdonella sp.]
MRNPTLDRIIAALHRSVAVAVACGVLAACAVPPRPELPPLRSEAPLAGLALADHGDWPAAQWWRQYADRQLDDLETRALANSPSLDEAQRRLQTLIAAVDSARATAGLAAQGNLELQRQRLSENGLIPPRFLGFTWYNQADLNLQFKYDFDLFGKTRAAVAGAIDQARAGEAERSAASLALTAAVADVYFGWQVDQAHLALARDSEQALERLRTLVTLRVARGIDVADSIHQSQARLAAARELRVAWAGSAQLRLAALAALLGVAPAELPTLQPHALPPIDAHLPADVGLDLIARRPDIAAARWRVEAAMRQVDRARAQFYPDIGIAGLVGLQSLDLDKLLNLDSRLLGVGPALHLPLFARGQLKAAYGVSQAQLDAAAAQYDAVVVSAANDVATQALALTQAQARRSEREAQLATAGELHTLATARARQGLVDERAVLAAQVELLQQRDALLALDAQSVAAQVALTKALGGGYRSDAPAGAPSHSTPTDRVLPR